jgi:hypothetical protein
MVKLTYGPDGSLRPDDDEKRFTVYMEKNRLCAGSGAASTGSGTVHVP